MLRKLLKNKKAQNTAEYALLIALVVAGVIAMQTYAQRALQARIRDASVYMSDKTSELGTSKQYEPYYLSSEYKVDRETQESQLLDVKNIAKQTTSNRDRAAAGFQESTYNSAVAQGAGVIPVGL